MTPNEQAHGREFCVKHGLRIDATANEAIKQFLERDQPPGDQQGLFDIPKL